LPHFHHLQKSHLTETFTPLPPPSEEPSAETVTPLPPPSEEPSAVAEPKGKKNVRSEKTNPCGECRGLVPKGYSCDLCCNWMHSSCGININPDDPKNIIRRCSSHYPKTSFDSPKDAAVRRPRWRVTPKKAQNPQFNKKKKAESNY
jgi:hypothetical protein